MKLSGRIGTWILLFSLVALTVPMVVFPAQFGTELARSSLLNVMFELVFYGFVIFLIQRRGTLLQLVQAAGVCLIYRLALGAVLGLLIASVYSMDIAISLNLGMSGYLPAIFFQIALAPLALKPVTDQFYAPRRRKVNRPVPVEEGPKAEPAEEGRTSIAVSKQRGLVKDRPARLPVVATEPAPPPEAPSPTPTPRPEETPRSSSDLNGFERAVRYIGEHGSVYLAAVVDHEGLTLANLSRGGYESDRWAPLALLFLEENGRVLLRGLPETPEKLDIVLKDKRITVADTGQHLLMVIAERQTDDVLNIRINQGLEMVARYVAERYGDRLNQNAERVNVSGAQ